MMKGRYQTRDTSVLDPDPMFLSLPDPHPVPCSHKSVERTEIMVAKYPVITPNFT
jgi:hypothetical protein